MSHETEARRVHPGTIALGWIKSAPSTVLGLPAVLAVTSGRGIGWILAITAVAVAASLFFAWLGWWSFTYRIGDGELVIERGVLHRSRRSIPLERIQDVSIEQKPLARLFGLALVRTETGGGEADEASLDSVTLAEAKRLRAALRGTPAPAVDTAPASIEPERPVFAMALPRVLAFGMFNFSLLWIAAIFGLLQSAERLVDIEWRALLGFAEREVRSHLTLGAVLTVLGLALLLGVVAGVVRTVATHFGFSLFERGDRFRRVRGLLTRSEVVVAKPRIQLGLVRRAPLRGRLGWESLEVQTLGGSDDSSGRQELAPFARAGEIVQVAEAAGLPAFERHALRPVARGHVLRAALRHGAPLVIVAGIAGLVLPPLWWALALLPVPIGVALLQRRHHLYGLRETSLQVARGVLSQRDWTVPYAAVQSITVRRNWLQRRLGLATVSVDTAGAKGLHRPEIADVRTAEAAEVALALVARAG